jgi:hypothetical protein
LHCIARQSGHRWKSYKTQKSGYKILKYFKFRAPCFK